MRLIELSKIVGVENDYDEEPVETTVRWFINVEHVRDFGPRKAGKPGTRIVMVNGFGNAYAEGCATVKSMLEGH